ncbi:MAG: glucose-1-phosphate adenylyltransferase [Armatimonadetes bacterium]|nr:glucose-1-phosphate adenylyltransferase [Armatimonadota bacterium]
MKKTIVVILSGGIGKRLYPLTKLRSKPAVPLGGKYRLVDIPISNCINSGINRINVLTQFNSESLNRHISRTYKFEPFSQGHVEILAAEQTPNDTSWYQGTADAVRQNLHHLRDYQSENILILSGDQLYRMDFSVLLHRHYETKADITVSAIPISEKDCSRLGIMKLNRVGRIVEFNEKPKDKQTIEHYKVSKEMLKKFDVTSIEKTHLASMGIYLFKTSVLNEILTNSKYTDFGNEIIPLSLKKYRVYCFIFNGYWEDIGTIKSFYEANLNLIKESPPFDFYSQSFPVYTRSRHLPPANIIDSTVKRALICEGSFIYKSKIESSIIGLRSVIREDTHIMNSIIMGADYFETLDDKMENTKKRIPDVGIGANSIIENAIIDKNVHIGENVIIKNLKNIKECTGGDYCIRDSIVVVIKNSVIKGGTVI